MATSRIITPSRSRDAAPTCGAVPRTAVAVAIVNYNGGATLAACLRAVSSQTVAPLRVFVIDNDSTDGSTDDLERRFPSVVIVRQPGNVGFAAAANAAVRRARGCRWVAILNSDAIPNSGWLEQLVLAAEVSAGCAAVSSHMLRADDPTILDGAGDVYHVSGAAWRSGHARRRLEHASASATGPYEVFSACGAAALFRRDAFLASGGFDAAYFCYFEDVDLGFRLRLAGHRCWHAPQAVVRHVGGASSGARGDFALYHGHRNLVWTYWRNMPASLFWRYLPQHVLWNLVTLAWFTLRGRGRVIFRSKWDALRQLPRVLRQRAAVQRTRAAPPTSLRAAMKRGLLRPYLARR